MNDLQADYVMKAVVDGFSDYAAIAKQAGIEPSELVKHGDVLDRAISLMRGFYQYGHENMKPAGLPPPKNPYFNSSKGIEDQIPEYYAYEAVQRGNSNHDRCLLTCSQLGLEPEEAKEAIDNVMMPWREVNGWRSYVQVSPEGHFVLQDKPPVKLKRHLERLLDQLTN